MAQLYYPSFERLLMTPLRDLLRGRITGRLDWRNRIAGADLPNETQWLIDAVVRRTRLGGLEKRDVADELIAHFLDARESGRPDDEVRRVFGDVRIAAKMIRRAKIQNRPLTWHAWRFMRRAIGVLALAYLALGIHFMIGRPRATVDYVAKLNEPLRQIPADDRAWPFYREAILRLELVNPKNVKKQPRVAELGGTSPGDSEWPELSAWLERHRDGIELLHQAAERPRMGFIYGPSGSANDPALGWSFSTYKTLTSDGINENDSGLISVLLPHVNLARTFADILAAEAYRAAEADDVHTFERCLYSITSLAEQIGGQFVVDQLVATGIQSMSLGVLRETLADRPDWLDRAALGRIAHRVSRIRHNSSRIDLTVERMFFHDVIQRTYTDDGHGDGRLTWSGLKTLMSYTFVDSSTGSDWDITVLSNSVMLLAASRREVLAEHDRLMNQIEAEANRPVREADSSQIDQRLTEIKTSSILRARYLPITILTVSFKRAAESVERLLSERDGMLVALATEDYRREHGVYPASLDALVPALLPAVPVDRIGGGPIRYRLVDDRPVIYSVGVDRDDDGGRPPMKDDAVRNWTAAAWTRDGVVPDGDWVLFPDPDSRQPKAK